MFEADSIQYGVQWTLNYRQEKADQDNAADRLTGGVQHKTQGGSQYKHEEEELLAEPI